MKTQNGYKALSQRKMDRSSFAGVMCIGGIRNDRHGRLLNYFAIEFHMRVEELEYGNCWGWAPVKKISGPDSDYSNHGSGTAIDLNETRHKLGRSNTFTKKQVSEIRLILEEFNQKIRWGGDYSRPDEMHFEIHRVKS
ncbi:M15 family metallopeptidase [Candidatus Saccharibacteria bacterium]|jgi:hypothetical protein|nr:M15 family metallopeptidase [Candidatus Saccharibacteria bacterium]